MFTGGRRQVTVMFVDIRDFTPFSEADTAEDTVARFNALFEIVVLPSSTRAGTSTSCSVTALWRSLVPRMASRIMPMPS